MNKNQTSTKTTGTQPTRDIFPPETKIDPRDQDVSTLHDYVTTLLWGLNSQARNVEVKEGW